MALIEREAAESAIAKLMPSFTPDGSGQFDEIIYYAQQMCGDAIETIRELPSIDAAPVVHGYVIDNGNPICGPCSACGESVNRKARYCSMCGARMGGERHEAD